MSSSQEATIARAASFEEKVVTKKDVGSAFWRWFFGAQIAWNYETMQSGGVVLALGPVLRKIYRKDEDFNAAFLSHFTFFNTNPWSGALIIGATIAAEEEHDPKDPEATREAVTAIKTGLMGPLAGIGDAVLFTIPFTIFGALAASFAQSGSPIGILFPLAYSIAMIFGRRWLFHMGYRQGAKFVTSLSTQMRLLADAASVLGLMVIGALIATVVSVTIPTVFSAGGASVELQTTLDSIMPYLVPAGLVGLTYWLLGKKWMSSSKAILLIIAIAFIGYFAGLFGVAG